MVKNNYFDHTDLKGNSPFDRMHKDGITFDSAEKISLTGRRVVSMLMKG